MTGEWNDFVTHRRSSWSASILFPYSKLQFTPGFAYKLRELCARREAGAQGIPCYIIGSTAALYSRGVTVLIVNMLPFAAEIDTQVVLSKDVPDIHS